MKIYTKTGDDGTTGLFGGQRVSKGEMRVEAYGTVDEVNSLLGVARAMLPVTSALHDTLQRLQEDLFVVGADLATPRLKDKDKSLIARIDTAAVEALEAIIDRLDADLPPLKSFILPSGSPQAAHLYLARAVCRRAERVVVRASENLELGPVVVLYLNRLSDLLFVLGRAANAEVDVVETPWLPERTR